MTPSRSARWAAPALLGSFSLGLQCFGLRRQMLAPILKLAEFRGQTNCFSGRTIAVTFGTFELVVLTSSI